jgi:alpha-beta hydrolase superfamily lysophospholipase
MGNLPDTMPAMVIIGGSDPCHEDFLALQQISAEFHGAGKRMPKVVVIGEARHELFNERQPEREDALSEVVDFFAAQLKPISRL